VDSSDARPSTWQRPSTRLKRNPNSWVTEVACSWPAMGAREARGEHSFNVGATGMAGHSRKLYGVVGSATNRVAPAGLETSRSAWLFLACLEPSIALLTSLGKVTFC
jgi:hypothetical protein